MAKNNSYKIIEVNNFMVDFLLKDYGVPTIGLVSRKTIRVKGNKLANYEMDKKDKILHSHVCEILEAECIHKTIINAVYETLKRIQELYPYYSGFYISKMNEHSFSELNGGLSFGDDVFPIPDNNFHKDIDFLDFDFKWFPIKRHVTVK